MSDAPQHVATTRAFDVVCAVRTIGRGDDSELTRLATVLRDALGDLAVGDRMADDTPHSLDIHHTITDRHRPWTIAWDGEVVHHLPDAANALAGVMSELSARASISVAATHTVLHAATIAVPDATGRAVAVALVGAGGAGKSTLAAACVRRGLGYLSDELCCIAPDGTVRAFHRPLCLRAGGADLVGLAHASGGSDPHADPLFGLIRPLRASALGTLADGLSLGAILFLDRRSDLCQLDPITRARALFRLSDQTVGPSIDGEAIEPAAPLAEVDRRARVATFRRLETLVRRVPVRSLRYGDLDAAIDLLCCEIPKLAT